MRVLEPILEATDLFDKRVTYVLVETERPGSYAVVVRPRRGVWECTCEAGAERVKEGLAADCEHAKAAAEFVNPPETGSRFAPGAGFDPEMFA